jgi:hypothetical protein
LDFAPVFARGGFDLQVGNPPWVRPSFRETLELAEFDPWWQLNDKPSREQEAAKRRQVLTDPERRIRLCDRLSKESGAKSQISSDQIFPLLSATTPNLYRNFIVNAWRHCRPTGIVGLLHPSNHLKDDAFISLRRECYWRLRRNWEFRNQLKLFTEIGNTRPYSVGIYGCPRKSINFLHASWILHPETVSRSLVHDGRGTPPGIKNETGWDISPHLSRIVRVTDRVVRNWATILRTDPDNASVAPTISTPNDAMLFFLAKVASSDSAVSRSFHSSQGWSESTYRRKGFYRKETSVASDWNRVILQSPQIGVANAFFQEPNLTAKSHRDYSEIDLDAISEDFIPRTSYQVSVPVEEFVAECEKWDGSPYTMFFRIAWSEMCDPFGRRTLQSCLIPKGATHVHAIISATDLSSAAEMVCMLGVSHSIVIDATIKLMGVDHIKPEAWQLVPRIVEPKARRGIMLRTLRLNALTNSYGPIWRELFDDDWMLEDWCPGIGGQYAERRPLGEVQPVWTPTTPLRTSSDRRQALIELDALVAVALGISAEELLTIYRGLFPVDRQIEAKTVFDARGRAIPRAFASEALTGVGLAADMTFAGVTYQGPFAGVDRERDMELAHKHFSDLLGG